MSKSHHERLVAAISCLQSTDVKIITKSLNFLLWRTSDAAETSSGGGAVVLENYPLLLLHLSALLDILHPLSRILFPEVNGDAAYLRQVAGRTGPLETWAQEYVANVAIPEEFLNWARFADDNNLFLSCLGIIRNLSFEVSNEVYLAYHTGIMRHLISTCFIALISPHPFECIHLAFDTVMRLANRIDLYGIKRSQLLHIFDEPSTDANSKELLKLKISKEMSQQSLAEYIHIIRSLLYILLQLLQPDYTAYTVCHRHYLLLTFEILTKLLQVEENLAYFVQVPNEFIQRLLRLLAVNFTFAESIVQESYFITGDCLGRFRPPAGIIAGNTRSRVAGVMPGVSQSLPLSPFYPAGATNPYFTSDYIDTELRDMAVDCLVVLCRCSRENGLALLRQPHALQMIFDIANAGHGPFSANVFRTEGNVKAAQLLGALIYWPEHEPYLRRLRTDLLVAATYDEHLAGRLRQETPQMS